jgi:RHS repeat-associated protein
MRTAVSGSSCETIVSLAFGDGQLTTGNCSDASPMHFTGKQRDPETNLDDFDARYYSSQWGRFISADWSAVPEPVPYANLANPQSLNLYAIVADSPATDVDADGHVLELAKGDESDEYNDLCRFVGDACKFLSEGSLSSDGMTTVNISCSLEDCGYWGGANAWYVYVQVHSGGVFVYGGYGYGFWTLSLYHALIFPPHEASAPDISDDFLLVTGLGGLARAGVRSLARLAIGAAEEGAAVGAETLTNAAAGKIIGWGKSQAPEAIAQTEKLTQTLTQGAVKEMADKGLTLKKVQELADVYADQIGKGMTKVNKQLGPRLQLMQKIIELWPSK